MYTNLLLYLAVLLIFSFSYWKFFLPANRPLAVLIISIAILLFNFPLLALQVTGISSAVYLASKRLAAKKDRLLLILACLGVLLFWVYTNNVKSAVFFIGVSYLTLKLLHYLIDVYQDRYRPVSFSDFLLFIFFFPTYAAGPIENIPHFLKNIVQPQPYSIQRYNSGLIRICLGLFIKKPVANFLALNAGRIFSPRHTFNENILLVIAGTYLYFGHLYFDFSGYTDIAIGSANLFGYNVLENFDRPFLKSNIPAFWRSWHMTLTRWLWDYIYYPLCRALLRLRFLKAPWVMGGIGAVFTMAACGLWHGQNLNFLIWGVYNGLGLFMYKIYSDHIRKKLYLRKYVSERARYCLSVFLTLNFVSFGWIFFFNDYNMICYIIRKCILKGG